MASSDSADAVKNIFSALSPGQGLNGNIGVGKNTVDCFGNRRYQLLGALKSYGAGEAHGEIGEITVAGAANTHSPNLKNTIHMGDGFNNLSANPGGSGVEQGVGGASRQPPTYGNDDAGYEQRSDRIG